MALFKAERQFISLSNYGITSCIPPSNKFDTENVYKINKKHLKSLYQSEGFLHERADNLCFPKNRLQRFKLIDDEITAAEDQFAKLCFELNKNSWTKLNEKQQELYFTGNLKNQNEKPKFTQKFGENSEYEEETYTDFLAEQKRIDKAHQNWTGVLVENLDSVPEEQNDKNKRNYSLDHIGIKLFDRPVIKTFKVKNRNNRGRSACKNEFKSPLKTTLESTKYFNNKDKLYLLSKQELIKLLEKNNQKEEVLLDRKLHYFYKTARNSDENVYKLNYNTGKSTAEEIMLKPKKDIRQEIISINENYNSTGSSTSQDPDKKIMSFNYDSNDNNSKVNTETNSASNAFKSQNNLYVNKESIDPIEIDKYYEINNDNKDPFTIENLDTYNNRFQEINDLDTSKDQTAFLINKEHKYDKYGKIQGNDLNFETFRNKDFNSKILSKGIQLKKDDSNTSSFVGRLTGIAYNNPYNHSKKNSTMSNSSFNKKEGNIFKFSSYYDGSKSGTSFADNNYRKESSPRLKNIGSFTKHNNFEDTSITPCNQIPMKNISHYNQMNVLKKFGYK